MHVTSLNCPCLKADLIFYFEYRNILLLKIYSLYYIRLANVCEMSLTGADLKERAKMHSSEVSSFVSKARATINEMGM